MAIGLTQGIADLGFGWLSPKVGLRRLFAACNAFFGLGVVALAVAFPSISGSAIALTATVCAVGLGSGVWGDRKKVSADASGSGFRADDRLRPCALTTYDLRYDD